MSDVLFPQMSDDPETTGVIVTWFFSDGEAVEAGDLVAEDADDKVDMELHAEHAGTLTVLVPEETEVTQGTVIARID